MAFVSKNSKRKWVTTNIAPIRKILRIYFLNKKSLVFKVREFMSDGSSMYIEAEIDPAKINS